MRSIAILLAVANAVAATAAPLPPRFLGDAEVTTSEGHLTLRWEGGRPPDDAAGEAGDGADPAAPRYRLEHVHPGGEREVFYEGPATQSFVSGLEEGVHRYRVRARTAEDGPWSDWSDAVTVEVAYQSMQLAWTLFATGLVMFGAIVVFVIAFARRTASQKTDDRFRRGCDTSEKRTASEAPASQETGSHG